MTDLESRTVATNVLESLTPNARVELHPLKIRSEDNQYIVGRIMGEFVTLPEVGVRVIELFQHSYSLGEAQALLQQEYDVEIDLNTFVLSLVDLSFVKAVDGHLLIDKPTKPLLRWLQPYHVNWLFTFLPVRILYITLLLAAGFTLITHIQLIPRYQDFFWSTSTSVLLVGNTAISLVNLTVHELSHLIAAVSLGLPASISLGTRLHELVVQTQVSSLWALPRRYRYRVYLAGILFELASMSVALLLLAHVPFLPVSVQNMLRALILIHFFGIGWQFHFYMRTDIYFVIQDLWRCHNLFDDSLTYLRFRTQEFWHRIFHPHANNFPVNPLAYLPVQERRKVVVYSWLILVGSTVSLLIFVGYTVPILIQVFVQASVSIWHGIILGQPLKFVDGLVTICVTGSFQATFVVVFLKKHKKLFFSLHKILKSYLH